MVPRPLDTLLGSVAILASGLVPAGASAQTVRLAEGGLAFTHQNGHRVEIQLPCRPLGLAQLGDRVYVAAGACGVVRLEVSPDQIRRMDRIEPGVGAREVIVRGRTVFARGRTGLRVIDRLDRPWEAAHAGFVDPSAGERSIPERFTTPAMPPIQRPPRVATPPRHGDSWEIGGELGLAYGVDSANVGLLVRAHLVYRTEVPLTLRVDLMPLGVADHDGPIVDALAIASVSLDLHGFALGVGGGVTTMSQRYRYSGPIPPAAAGVLGYHLRIGVTDGLHLFVGSGLAFYDDAVDFAFIDTQLQIPLVPEVAIVLRGLVGVFTSGYVQVDGGVRVWLEGLGAPGSVGVIARLGLAMLTYQEPDFSRSMRRITRRSLVGPALTLGVEARL